MLTIGALALLPLIPQELSQRSPVPIGSAASPGGQRQLSVAFDRLAFSWPQPSATGLFVSSSDGRGLDWTSPLAVGLTVPPAAVLSYRTLLVGDRLLMIWDDTRLLIGATSGPKTTPYLRALNTSTGLLEAELALPNFGLVGGVETRVYASEQAAVGMAEHVHLLLLTREVSTQANAWRLLSSHDGGRTFPYTLDLDLDSPTSTLADLAVEGNSVHVLLREKHFRSLDGGQSLDSSAASTIAMPAGSGTTDLELSRAGGALTAGWVRIPSSSGDPLKQLEAVVSEDGGTTFSALETVAVGSSSLDLLILDDALTVPDASTRVVTWHSVNQNFPQGQIFSACKLGAGPWNISEISSASILGPEWVDLVGDPNERSRLLAVWSAKDFIPAFGRSFVRISRDGGQTWSAAQQLGPMGTLARSAAFERRYQNGAWILQTGTQWLAGGARAQTLNPSGFVAGPTQFGAEFRGFDDGSNLGWVLAGLSTSPLPLADGRLLGLGADALLLETLNLALAGTLAAPLDGNGNGQIAPLPLALPPGLSLNLVGVGINTQTFAVGDLSDVIQVTAN